MTTVIIIMMSDIVPLRERGIWQGILNIIYAVGSGGGAPLGTLSSYFSRFFTLPPDGANYQPSIVWKKSETTYANSLLGGALIKYIGWRW